MTAPSTVAVASVNVVACVQRDWGRIRAGDGVRVGTFRRGSEGGRKRGGGGGGSGGGGGGGWRRSRSRLVISRRGNRSGGRRGGGTRSRLFTLRGGRGGRGNRSRNNARRGSAKGRGPLHRRNPIPPGNSKSDQGVVVVGLRVRVEIELGVQLDDGISVPLDFPVHGSASRNRDGELADTGGDIKGLGQRAGGQGDLGR